MIEYQCPECEVSHYELRVIPKKKCPKCGQFMDCEEELE